MERRQQSDTKIRGVLLAQLTRISLALLLAFLSLHLRLTGYPLGWTDAELVPK
jgi:hypothetical protein